MKANVVKANTVGVLVVLAVAVAGSVLGLVACASCQKPPPARRATRCSELPELQEAIKNGVPTKVMAKVGGKLVIVDEKAAGDVGQQYCLVEAAATCHGSECPPCAGGNCAVANDASGQRFKAVRVRSVNGANRANGANGADKASPEEFFLVPESPSAVRSTSYKVVGHRNCPEVPKDEPDCECDGCGPKQVSSATGNSHGHGGGHRDGGSGGDEGGEGGEGPTSACDPSPVNP